MYVYMAVKQLCFHPGLCRQLNLYSRARQIIGHYDTSVAPAESKEGSFDIYKGIDLHQLPNINSAECLPLGWHPTEVRI